MTPTSTTVPGTEVRMQEAREGLGDVGVFRRVLSHFATGVVVVTAFDGEPVGMTCQSFSSLSLDPPLIVFCPAHSSTTWPRIRAIGSFAVNILSADQEATCRQFALSGTDKFAGVRWSHGATTDAPVLAGAVAHIECRLGAVYDGGDHAIVLGHPLAVGEDPELDPLLFFRSHYGTFAD